MSDQSKPELPVDAIAIIGMAGRFPGAKNIDEFWQNLRTGTESISFFSAEDADISDLNREMIHDPNYVLAGGILEGIEQFDASFFGLNRREAELMDPQQRLFLECVWEALEHAGYDPQQTNGQIGLFAGSSLNTYFLMNLLSNQEMLRSSGSLQAIATNEKDYLCTRTSYKLALKGPSITVQTACSTALVAVHLACESLLNGECSFALAGGVCADAAQKAGYIYNEGGIFSPDGHCRAFDAKAQGSVFGNGIGVVMLRRLEDAYNDGDHIYAIIRGSAVNNDGDAKVGYTAPSIRGQARVIVTAQEIAGVNPDSISYIEAHGSATALGDPIEVTALTQAFRRSTQRRGFCALGSVKTNVGHLNAAAGIAGLIKTTLALYHEQIPPSLHFNQPNPNVDFTSSPFYVNTTLQPWPRTSQPRRAGVSAFGIGGTNAHLILEEAPSIPAPSAQYPTHLLLLSARSQQALDRSTAALHTTLLTQPSLLLADVAHTLQVGRRAFQHRRVLVCHDREDALQALTDRQRWLDGVPESENRGVVFMFTGLGDQYSNMGAQLYQEQPVFKQAIDDCCTRLFPHLQVDLRTVMYTQTPEADTTTQPQIDLRRMLRRGITQSSTEAQLYQTYIAQPALFVTEYALAQLWIHLGVQPDALIGYSLGEYVSACIAGVLNLDEALLLVARRAQLIATLPESAMLAIPLDEYEVQRFLFAPLTLAAINAPELCVVAGPRSDIDQLEQVLGTHGIVCQHVQTDHAMHSPLMEPIRGTLDALAATLHPQPPRIPLISNVTGTWITDEEATDPYYWGRHLCQTVHFANGIAELIANAHNRFLEIGPGQGLCSIVSQFSQQTSLLLTLSSLRPAYSNQSDRTHLFTTAGQLWLAGLALRWPHLCEGEPGRRVGLSTYPFERERYWALSTPQHTTAPTHDPAVGIMHHALEQTPWYSRSWQRSFPPGTEPPSSNQRIWLAFSDENELTDSLLKGLHAPGQRVIHIRRGPTFMVESNDRYQLNWTNHQDFVQLFQVLGSVPHALLYLCGLQDESKAPDSTTQQDAITGLLLLLQALETKPLANTQLWVLTNNAHHVGSDDKVVPHHAPLGSLLRVIAQEYTFSGCHWLDLSLPSTLSMKALGEQLVTELSGHTGGNDVVAYRGRYRWIEALDPLPLQINTTKIPEDNTYLLTDGWGVAGQIISKLLVEQGPVKLALLGYPHLPPRNEWTQHGTDDEVARAIRFIQQLEACGADVISSEVTCDDEDGLRATLSLVQSCFHSTPCVLYTNMLNSRAIALADLDPASICTALQQRANELNALAGAYGKDVQRCILFSSLDSVFARPTSAQETALAALTDATAYRYVDQGWMCINGVMLPDGSDAIIDSTRTLLQLVLAYQQLPQIIKGRDAMQETGQPSASNKNVAYDHRTENVAYVAPSNDAEQQLTTLWESLLGVTPVGINDNFFALGGHSLTGMRLISRINQLFQINLPLQILFRTPTIAEMAVAVEAALIAEISGQSDIFPSDMISR